jgi:LmbE family N-acetylglucosaminyl deacetylase
MKLTDQNVIHCAGSMFRGRAVAQRHICGFLNALAVPGKHPLDCREVLVVAAHPDDETIGLGGHLPRLNGIRLVHVTDGAPADMKDARANGFETAASYATARRNELERAMGVAGIGAEALLSLAVPDQSAAFRMPFLARRLATIFQEHGTAAVITHAYEGGHPDHDATAFAVHAARDLLARDGVRPPDIIEFPLYHARNGSMVVQAFPNAAYTCGPELAIQLPASVVCVKQTMLEAYKTQTQTVAPFNSSVERFRVAPRYDFSQSPNVGELHYERFRWGMTGAAWQMLVEEASRELGFPRWP